MYMLVRIVYILIFNHTLALSPTPVNMRNCKLFMHVKILQKNDFVVKAWPAKLVYLCFDP